MTLSPNTTLAHYTIIANIGAGGMGEVYRARDSRLDREVAIKLLPAEFSSDSDRLKRFEQEARATSALNHPNILTVYDIGTNDGSPYIVAELLEGEELRDRFDRGPIPLRKAIDYAQQVVSGLTAAHEKGIIHRDLKPENLFICNDERVKILDFGLAKHSVTAGMSQSEDATRKVLTNPGVVMGTVGYMSPEQVRGEKADHRCDIFSFGAILHEMITGKRAFRRDTMAETMTAILREEPEELSASNPNINPALERIVQRCLEKKPERRFHSAHDLGFALESLSAPSSSSSNTLISHAPHDASETKKSLLDVPPGYNTNVILNPVGRDRPQALHWLPDSRSFAYIVTRDGVSNIWSVAVDGGAPKQLTNFTTDQIGWFDLSRDGKPNLFSRGATTKDVVLISGFKQ